MMRRLLSILTGVALVVGGVVGVGAVVASASGSPTMTVTPNTGLTSNQEVVITGTGFPTGGGLVAVECIGTATTVAGCNTNALTPINVNSDGSISATNFFVQTGPVGNGSCGTSSTDLKCAIAIGTLAGVLVADSSITFAAPSTTPSGPSVTVTPSTALANGQTVVITGSGFTPGDSVYALECLVGSTSQAGCDVATLTPITVKSDGTLPSTNFTVATGHVGTGTCGTTSADASGCIIAVANASQSDAGGAPITFAVAAPTVPTVTVTPSNGLKNGQSVTITGSGFTAGESVYAVECLVTATGAAGCNTAGATAITVNADGTLPSTTFTVATGTIGTGTCGTNAANAHGCAISVSTATGADAGAAPIAFAIAKPRPVPRALFVRPSANLRNGQFVTVYGRGFIARDHVYIVECLVGATSAGRCDLHTLKAVTIRPNGTLPPTRYRVVSGKIGTGFCGTTRANLHSCTISVANASKGDAKFVRIGFRLP